MMLWWKDVALQKPVDRKINKVSKGDRDNKSIQLFDNSEV